MYESFYGLSGKPFQLNPDPAFYFGSRGHKRAYAYLQYGLYQSEGFIVITGEIGAGKTTIVRSLFEHIDRDKLVAAQLVSTQLDADDMLRAVGAAFGLPHAYSGHMTYYLWGISQKRGWINGAILLQTFCLFITYSRSAIFVGALTTVVWVGLMWLRERKFPTLFWISAISALLSLGLLYPQIFHRGGIVSYNQVSQSSDTLRMTVQDVGLAMFKAHPFLGVGFNHYMLAFSTFAQGLSATYIHNVYLHLCVEIGLFGTLAFVVFCALILVKGWKKRDQPEVMTCLCIFAGLLLIGMADFYPLCQQEIRLIFFLVAGFIGQRSLTVDGENPRL